MRRFINVYDTGLVNLSASTQNMPERAAQVLGHVVGMRITLKNVSAAGTLTTPAAITAAVNVLEVDDSAHSPLFSIAGSDIPILGFVLSPRGTYVSPLTVSNSDQSQSWVIQFPVAVARQPLYIKGTWNAYSALAASGATGGTAELVIDLMVDDSPVAQRLGTYRLRKWSASGIAGDNILQEKLDTSAQTIGLVANVGADSNLTWITFYAQVAPEINQMTPDAFASEDAIYTVSGHQSGIEILRVSPFIANAATYFDVNLASATTITVYQIERV